MIQGPKETLTLVRSTLLTREETELLIRRVFDLREQRRQINAELRTIYSRVKIVEEGPDEDRPRWGPCTRCGHSWFGQNPDRPPTCCPRCGSSGWRTAPKRAWARKPSDPPSARWGKNRKTGKTTDPTQKVGEPEKRGEMPQWMKDRLARLKQEENGKIRSREQERGLAPPPRLDPPSGTSSTVERGPSTPEAAGSSPASRSTLAPPPKLADVAPTLVEERRGPVKRSVGGFIRRVIDEPPPVLDVTGLLTEPDDGVPVRIMEDGRLEVTERVPGEVFFHTPDHWPWEPGDELLECVEGDGSIGEDQE